MQTYGYDYSQLAVAGWLCLVVSVYFAYRRPAANAFLNLTLVGIGGTPLIAEFTAARISAFVAFSTVLMLLIRSKRVGAASLAELARSPLAWFAGVCLLVLVKIMIETGIYGYDASRAANLQAGLTESLFPIVVVLLGSACDGQDTTTRDLLLGMAVFPIAMLAGYLPSAANDGQLLAAWNGASRFTLAEADTINSARVLTYGALGSVMLYSLPRKGGSALRLMGLPLALGFILLLLLNGNRQFLLALFVFLGLWSLFLQRSGLTRLIVRVIAAVGLVLVTYQVAGLGTPLVTQRFSNEAFRWEESEGRGAIWSDALRALLEHPAIGVGFKNFGREIVSGDVVLRDSAHGVFQDVLTEHGVFLGLAFLIGCVHLTVRSWHSIQQQPGLTADKYLTVGLLALLVPLLLSSVFLNATPVYLLLVLAMVRDAGQLHKRTGVDIRWNQWPLVARRHFRDTAGRV